MLRIRVEIAAAVFLRQITKELWLVFNAPLTTNFFPVEVNLPLIEKAARLAEKHVLRGYDAVQLAAAMQVEAERKSIGATTLTLVSADTELLNAAQIEGLLIENPNLHP